MAADNWWESDRAPAEPAPAAAPKKAEDDWASEDRAPVVSEPAGPVEKPRPTLAEREGVPRERQGRFNAYADQARAQRDSQPATERYLRTGARGVFRGFPLADDAASFGESLIGRGEGDGFQNRYSDNLLRNRAMNAVDDEDRPFTSYGGQIAGAFALPAGALSMTAGLKNKVKLGAGLGAGYGAASGFGAGYDLGDRAERSVKGGGIGAGLGALLPLIGAGAVGGLGLTNQFVAQPLANAARSLGPTIRGYVDPAAEALNRVRSAIGADVRSGSERLRPDQDWMQSYEAGQKPVVGDFGGTVTKALGRSSANTSGDDTLARVTSERFKEQNVRTADFFRNLTGLKTDPVAAEAAIKEAAKAANKPLYDAAYAKGEALWGDDLQKFAERPTVQDAIKVAIRRANDRVGTDQPQVRHPFNVDKQTGEISLRAAADGSIPIPNLAFWDLVKRGLDDVSSAAQRGGKNDESRVVGGMSRELRDMLDDRVPEYAAARGTAAQFFGADNALQSGQMFARGQMPTARSAAEFKAMMEKMPPHERDIFGQGYAMEVVQAALNSKDTVNVTNRLFGSPEARTQMRMVLGPERAFKLEGYVHRENIMDRLRTAVTGNSTTARQLQELGLAGGTLGAGTAAGAMLGGDFQSATMGGLLAGLVRGAKGRVDLNVSREVGRLLSSDSPADIDRALRLIEQAPGGPGRIKALSAEAQRLLPRPAGPQAAMPAPSSGGRGPAGSAAAPAASGKAEKTPNVNGTKAIASETGSNQKSSAAPAAGVVAGSQTGSTKEPKEK